MYVRYHEVTKRILAVSPNPLKQRRGTVIVEVPWLTHTNIDYLYVDKDGNVQEYLDKEKVNIDNGKFLRAKNRLLQILDKVTTDYIYHYYSELKQQSDLIDKDYCASALLMINSEYTIDQLYKDLGNCVNQILNGETTLEDIINGKDSEEQPHWEQLIKTAVRTAWVKRCKYVYNDLKNQINGAESFAELLSFPDIRFDDINVEGNVFPKYPEISNTSDES